MRRSSGPGWARYVALVRGHTRGRGGWFAVVVAALVAGAGLQVASPLVVRAFLDLAQAGAAVERLVGVAVLFIGVAVAGSGLEIVRSHAGAVLAWQAMNSLRRMLFLHTVDLGHSFFARSTPGTLLERIDGDVARLGRLLSDLLPELAANLLMTGGIVVVLLLEDWRVGVAVAAFAVVGAVVVDRVRALGVPRFVRSREASAAFFGRLSEWLAAVEELRPLAGQRYLRASFERVLARWLPREVAAEVAGHALSLVNTLLFIGGMAVGLSVAAGLHRAGLLTLGTVWLVYRYSELIRGPLSALRTEMQQLQQAQAALTRIDQLLSEANAALHGDARLPPGPCSVEFDRVRFSYVAGAPVLREASFKLAAGTVLGLVGSTGGGKSTIARLLARMIELQEGSVRLGEVAVRDLGSRHLRERVAMLPQETEIVPGSLRDNVALFDDSVSAAAVAGAFQRLGAGTWLRDLGDGVETVIGPGGRELSSGERQLVAIARILLREPSLVILDEPAARIDPATEALVRGALAQLLRGRTGLVIAHRSATLDLVDSVALLERGTIVERIPRSELEAAAESRIASFLERGGIA